MRLILVGCAIVFGMLLGIGVPWNYAALVLLLPILARPNRYLRFAKGPQRSAQRGRSSGHAATATAVSAS